VVEGPTGQKPLISFFCGSSHFSATQYLPTQPKLRSRCVWVFCNFAPNFMPEHWQENFVLKELNDPQGG